MLYGPGLAPPQQIPAAPPPPTQPDPAAAPPARRPRIAALDAARALGTLAMVFGHTLDALLAPAVRASPAVAAYWKARGLTAPLFMMVSGWAVTVAISRSGAQGLAVPRARIRRVLLLLLVGYALRWPGWGADRLLAGDRAVWAHLLAFDALHTIAIALLATSLVLAPPLADRERLAAFSLLLLACVALGLLPPAPLAPRPSTVPAPVLPLALWQASGGTSPFPLFPWAGYFFAGAILALLAGGGGGRRAAGMAAAGAALVLSTAWSGVGTAPPGEPTLIAFRIGVVLIILALLSLVPAEIARWAAPLGRASLGVYAIHVPIVYGWSTVQGLAGRVGPSLGFAAAAAVAAAVLAASFALFRGLVALRDGALGLVARARARMA